MPVNPDFRDLFSELSAVEARYLVVGAHAVIYHATPRYTKDLDIWIEPTPDNAQRVYTALTRFGAPMETLEVEDLATSGTIFQIGVEPNRIDVITELKGLSFAGAWQRRIHSTYGDVPVALLGLDDLLVNKRSVGRPQDLLDVGALERARNSLPPET
ncbi:MAG TPA: hypothetical protein VGG06_04075 [Thermoanaerobaculia bacterium]|jgi:hypothetical protein